MSTHRQVRSIAGRCRLTAASVPTARRAPLAATAVLLATTVAAAMTVVAVQSGTASARAVMIASGPACPGQSAHNTAVTAGDFTKVNGVVPRPVVLVHGWDSSYKSMQGYASLLKTSKVLDEPLEPFLFDYSADSGRWAAIPAIAACLGAYVNEVSSAYVAAGGDGKVLTVGHSMGGLAIRFSSSAEYAAEPDGAVLGGVVTIDTPHLGSPWGDKQQAQLLQDWIQNTSGNFLEGVIPLPPGGDGQVCLAAHTGSSGMPPGCATPPWLPASVPVAEVGGDITVHRQIMGFDIGTTNTGGDAVVQTSSSLGYQPASGPGAPPAPVQIPATYVDDCDITTGQLDAGLAGYGVSLVKGMESLILRLGTPAGNDIWNSPVTEPVATLLSLANLSAPCSHTNIENPVTDPFASLDVLKALNADLDQLTVRSSQGASWKFSDVDANNGLLSVSCPSSTFCAASDSNGKVSFYNGVDWSQPQDIDPSGGYLNSVSCAVAATSVFCAAVDNIGYVVAYNGNGWGQPTQIDPNGEGLVRVSCATPEYCVAVDADGSAFIYDGQTWTQHSDIDGSGGELWAVSCPTAGFCAAFDLDGYTLKTQGSGWTTPVKVDSSGSLVGGTISCASPTFCMISDSLGYVTAFTGKIWGEPTRIDDNRITSVSCSSPQFCMAVDIAGNELTYNGSSWSNPVPLEPQGELWSVSCINPGFCAAVGQEGLYTYG
jgi:pimeloyl-ACP methyl ester carboxylesterase